jgi:hypothetical protein
MASSGGINGTGTRSLDATLLRTSLCELIGMFLSCQAFADRAFPPLLVLVSEKDKDPAVLVSQFMRLVLQFGQCRGAVRACGLFLL